MAKKRKELFYHVRITEHKDIPKGKPLSIKERKVTRKIVKTVARVLERDPIEKEVIHADYVKKFKGYETIYHEGNVIRYSKSYYVKTQEEAKVLLQRSIKQNKKTKRTDISAIAQMIEGDIPRVGGKLKAGTKLSKPAKFVNVKRTAKQARKHNNFIDFENDLDTLELEMEVSPPPDKRKRKGMKKVTQKEREKRLSQQEQTRGRVVESRKERLQKQEFKPRKVTKREWEQLKRIKQTRRKRK